jgi:hypothetical protein
MPSELALDLLVLRAERPIAFDEPTFVTSCLSHFAVGSGCKMLALRAIFARDVEIGGIHYHRIQGG